MSTSAHDSSAASRGPATGLTPQLCEFLAGTGYHDLPREVLERTRYLLLDGIGCALLAAQMPWSRLAVAGTLPVDTGSGATLWGWGREVSPSAAALLNGTFVQGCELDDFHPHGALHSASVVVPAATAAAQMRGDVTMGEYLQALALGFEAGPRVGIAMGAARVTVRGWHSGAVFGPFAAAVAAGKIFGLDADALESALGNAGTRAGALMAAQYDAMVKRMHHGMASQAGLHGASLAAHGFIGIRQVIEQEFGGLASTLLAGEGAADLNHLVEALGQHWDMLGIGIKRHACLIMLHSTIDALSEYRRRSDADLDRIASVRIEVSQSAFQRAGWRLEPPATEIGAQMNLACAAALALVDGAAYLPQFTAASLARPVLWDIMDRIQVQHSPDIDARGHTQRFAAVITVQRKDGSVVTLDGVPPQQRPFSCDEVVTKFLGLLDGVADRHRAAAIVDLVLHAGADEPVQRLIDLLAPAVDPPPIDAPE